ncbi:hypothetical protein FB45DRAFT_915401 [Roridomyces roridus]|uniref:Uncharacterized protein n=1 Tax=Roridomyces roridus TaxID=1738132 RepID=A0AAD7FND6_9AGAR|nr:hypothetical protein FB45DRAFT_915401 [Roridomyces roridus]
MQFTTAFSALLAVLPLMASVNGLSTRAAAAASAQALQDSLTLDPNIIQTTGTGQEPPVAGQASALTSKNNFANICSLGLPNVPITNGLQLTGGSCNPIPIGNIPSIQNVPSSKFQTPTNGQTLAANTPFNVTLAVKNIQIGTFTAATETYYANPQTLNSAGQIIGHTHIVIEQIDSLASTTVTDPLKFAFFKGVDDAADGNGQVTVPVTAGLAAGVYRMGTIMSSATHQPVIVAVAQHGIVDDVIYMTVSDSGAAAASGAGAAAAASGANNAGAAAGSAAAGSAAAGSAAAGSAGKAAAAAAASSSAAAAAAASTGAAAATAAPATAAAASKGTATANKGAAAATAAKGTAANKGGFSKGGFGKGKRFSRSRL